MSVNRGDGVVNEPAEWFWQVAGDDVTVGSCAVYELDPEQGRMLLVELATGARWTVFGDANVVATIASTPPTVRRPQRRPLERLIAKTNWGWRRGWPDDWEEARDER